MQKLEKARARLIIEQIFFATLILSTEQVLTDRVERAGTDMERIYYNPAFIESLDVRVVMFVIGHEVLHIAFKHGLRRDNRNPELWNIACDYAINILLKDSGFEIWKDAYIDNRFRGMGAEEIYGILLREAKMIPPRDLGLDLLPLPDDTPARRVKVDQTITQRVVQATTIAKMQGNMPRGLDRAVNGMINPPLPWQELLRDFATRVAQDDETWSRRNRRYRQILPGRYSTNIGEFVIIGDTSRSMDDVFAQIGEELTYVMQYLKPELTRVIWADDEECSFQEEFTFGEDIVLHPKGFGGTDMRKPLRFVEQYNPIVVVLVTDCQTPWPSEPTPYPLIVCATSRSACPDWAMRVPLYPGA